MVSPAGEHHHPDEGQDEAEDRDEHHPAEGVGWDNQRTGHQDPHQAAKHLQHRTQPSGEVVYSAGNHHLEVLLY